MTGDFGFRLRQVEARNIRRSVRWAQQNSAFRRHLEIAPDRLIGQRAQYFDPEAIPRSNLSAQC